MLVSYFVIGYALIASFTTGWVFDVNWWAYKEKGRSLFRTLVTPVILGVFWWTFLGYLIWDKMSKCNR